MTRRVGWENIYNIWVTGRIVEYEWWEDDCSSPPDPTEFSLFLNEGAEHSSLPNLCWLVVWNICLYQYICRPNNRLLILTNRKCNWFNYKYSCWHLAVNITNTIPLIKIILGICKFSGHICLRQITSLTCIPCLKTKRFWQNPRKGLTSPHASVISFSRVFH